MPAAAEGFAVSVRTVAKWVRRFKEGGVAALEDGSSRPGAPPHQTPPAAVALIRNLREQHGLPAWAIGRALRIPRSTVSAWLRRLGSESAARRAAGARAALRVADGPATSCTWISSRSGVSPASGIASTAIGGAPRGDRLGVRARGHR